MWTRFDKIGLTPYSSRIIFIVLKIFIKVTRVAFCLLSINSSFTASIDFTVSTIESRLSVYKTGFNDKQVMYALNIEHVLTEIRN